MTTSGEPRPEPRPEDGPDKSPLEGTAAPAAVDVATAAVLLWQQSPDIAFVVLDTEGVITAWQGASKALFGYAESDIVGQPIDVLFVEEDRAMGLPLLERRVAVSAHRSEDDRWHRRKDGARIWVAGSMVALYDPAQAGQHIGFVKVMADRTNLRAQIETTENRLQTAHQTLQERDAFFGRLVHEVRNALGPIRIATELVARKALPAEEVASRIDIVKRQVTLMERMMNDLAEVVRFGAGKLRLEKTGFDLGAEVVAIADVVRADAAAKQQALSVLVPSARIPIVADRQRLHQIVFNLLHNAIKYTPAGGKIWLRCTVEIDHAVIRVEDTGIGIDAALLPVIFDLFTQEDPHRSDGGFGVGLSLVRDLVHAHGGFVEVRCDGKGHGSEFAVRLPLAVPEAAA
ncbi:PAS domain-containing sensor histidine kinase [Variovorax boronicumulans]|uniref:PAS domain-containing sensor histidine kinase n=1 Tax=Variovorax boronicumulans TaxID=436515 RepID=UPI0033971B2F